MNSCGGWVVGGELRTPSVMQRKGTMELARKATKNHFPCSTEGFAQF